MHKWNLQKYGFAVLFWRKTNSSSKRHSLWGLEGFYSQQLIAVISLLSVRSSFSMFHFTQNISFNNNFDLREYLYFAHIENLLDLDSVAIASTSHILLSFHPSSLGSYGEEIPKDHCTRLFCWWLFNSSKRSEISSISIWQNLFQKMDKMGEHPEPTSNNKQWKSLVICSEKITKWFQKLTT